MATTVITKAAVEALDCAARRQFQKECGIAGINLKFLGKSKSIWLRVYTKSVEEAVHLYESHGAVFARKCVEWALGKIQIFWSRYQKPIEILPEVPVAKTKENTLMVQENQEKFLWFGGMITPELRSHLLEMEESDTPTGLLQPVTKDGVLKTVQWGINSASVKLFNYDVLSQEDMEAAILRDTSGDWLPEFLEEKRKLYQQAGTNFEQVAPLKIKGGWMMVRIRSRRIGVGNLVLTTGSQESEVVERPEILIAA